ncbi:MAG: DUF1501 domain-containing protein [Planctomycetota bacterium]|nr:DUF1501 domain-containing protein [Planctomycetota bacterium]
MDCCNNRLIVHNRRDMLRTLSAGFGYLAFAGLAARTSAQQSTTSPLAPKAGHFAGSAKRVIFLCMDGGPSHVDTFDYKPQLIADNGKSLSSGFRSGAKLLASPWKFRQHGKSGLWISDLFPEVAKQADELCLLRGMHTGVPAHAQAALQMHTGSFQFVRPSLGAWTLYGLGTTNENLPGFVTLNPARSAQGYGSAFLPAYYQGSPMRMRGGNNRRGQGQQRGRTDSQSEAVANIENSVYTTAGQREQLDLVQALNKERDRRARGDTNVDGVIESYELAFRMQAEVPELLDFAGENAKTLAMYGIGTAATDSFGRQCLLARRLSEAGVRFVEISVGGFDTHRNLKAELDTKCQSIDQPIAALLTDLKQRGMLKDTLVLWGGEFGRTPYAQGTDGRDHNNKGFTMWAAGGGVRGGFSYGETDDYGVEAVNDKMHIHDWHATILHLLGLDHERLTYNYAGRDFRLTEVYGKVANQIIA